MADGETSHDDRIGPRTALDKFEKISLGNARRHLFLCCDQTVPRCSPRDETLASWAYLKKRLRELGLADSGVVQRTRANCLRVLVWEIAFRRKLRQAGGGWLEGLVGCGGHDAGPLSVPCARDLHTLTAETELVADLGIDSVKALELVIALEARLGIEISDEVATRMDTVGDLLGFLATP